MIDLPSRLYRTFRLWLTGRRELIQSHLLLQARVARLEEHITLLERQRDTAIDCLDRLKWMACADSAAAKGFIEHLGSTPSGS